MIHSIDISLEALSADTKGAIADAIHAAVAGGPKTGAVIAQPYVKDGVLRLKGLALTGQFAQQIAALVHQAKKETNND
jgi:hypothetical protein